jgi:hypothetical protein
LHKYLYAHANPVTNIDPSGLLATTTEQAAATKIEAEIAATAYILSFGRVSSLVMLNDKQQATMSKPRYAPYKPFLRTDEGSGGCLSADVPRSLGKAFENYAIESGELVVSDHWYYEYLVSGSWTGFFVITPFGIAYDYDGKTPGTRNVWEAKYGYSRVIDKPNSDLARAVPPKWEESRIRGSLVAEACGYQFRWAFSDSRLADRYRVAWGGVPPVYHVDERGRSVAL